MSAPRLVALAIDVPLLIALAWPLAGQLLRVRRGEPSWLLRAVEPFSRVLCRLAGLPAERGPLPVEAEMTPGRYALSLGAFLGAGVVLATAIERCHGLLLMSLWSTAPLHRIGPIVQSMVSAAIGLALLIALLRGLDRRRQGLPPTIGNFWADVIFGSLHILLPLSLVLTLFLAAQGLVQTGAAALAKVL